MAAPMPNPTTRTTAMAQAMAHARAAFASLQQYNLPPLPPHYAIWFDHHAGTRLDLCTALEAAIAQSRVDERLMRELNARFFEPLPEFTALSTALARLSGTLSEALGTISSHGADTAAFGDALEELSADRLQDPQRLRLALARLAEQARDMTRRSEDMGKRLATSTREIEVLRGELDDARREAHTDALTSLPNRRAFDDRLRVLAAETEAAGQPLALVLLDIDHFKRVNDGFGHPVGDALLRRTAGTIAAALREPAMAARFGGEEFAVLLPGLALADAYETAETLRLAVAAQTFALRNTGAKLGSITVSLGLAMHQPSEDVAELLTQADAALYRAKQEGRNRTMTNPPMPAPPPTVAVPQRAAAKLWG